MSKHYTIYNKSLAPEALKSKHPYAPTYKDEDLTGSIEVLLFIETLEDVTGTPADNIILIDQTEEELSNADLDAMVNVLLTQSPSGSEIQIIKSRGRYLYDTRFKPAE